MRTVLTVLMALMFCASAQASYLHTSDALRIVTHENRGSVRADWIGGFEILGTKRYSTHGVNVTVRLDDVVFDPSEPRMASWTSVEHVRLYPNGILTSHRDGFGYRYRERIRTGPRRSVE